jgi:hypothetical protein
LGLLHSHNPRVAETLGFVVRGCPAATPSWLIRGCYSVAAVCGADEDPLRPQPNDVDSCFDEWRDVFDPSDEPERSEIRIARAEHARILEVARADDHVELRVVLLGEPDDPTLVEYRALLDVEQERHARS